MAETAAAHWNSGQLGSFTLLLYVLHASDLRALECVCVVLGEGNRDTGHKLLMSLKVQKCICGLYSVFLTTNQIRNTHITIFSIKK